MSKEENNDLNKYHISHENQSLEESVKAERDGRTVEHYHTDFESTWPLTIAEKDLPALRKHMENRIPEFVDSDLPLEHILLERHLTEWEKRLGRSYQELNEALRSFSPDNV